MKDDIITISKPLKIALAVAVLLCSFTIILNVRVTAIDKKLDKAHEHKTDYYHYLSSCNWNTTSDSINPFRHQRGDEELQGDVFMKLASGDKTLSFTYNESRTNVEMVRTLVTTKIPVTVHIHKTDDSTSLPESEQIIEGIFNDKYYDLEYK